MIEIAPSVNPWLGLVDVSGRPAAEATPRTGEGSRHEERALPASEDDCLVKDSRAGSREAFDQLVRKHRVRVFRLCLRFCGDPYEADDLCQEIFLRAFRGLWRFREEARFSTWLHRITVNACLSWADRNRRHLEELSEDLPDPAPGQHEMMDREELGRTVRKALGRLPGKQRICLILRVYQGLSHREIAEILGGSTGTVKANVFFGLRNLRKMLAPERSSNANRSGVAQP